MGSQLIPIISTAAGNEIPPPCASNSPWLTPGNWQCLPTQMGSGICWDNFLDAPALSFGLEDEQVCWVVPGRGDKWEAASGSSGVDPWSCALEPVCWCWTAVLGSVCALLLCLRVRASSHSGMLLRPSYVYSLGVLSMSRGFVFPCCSIIPHLCATWPALPPKMTGQEEKQGAISCSKCMASSKGALWSTWYLEKEIRAVQ